MAGLAVHENQAIFPGISVGRAIVGIFGKILIGAGVPPDKRRERGRIVDLLHVVAAMGAGGTGHDGPVERSRRGGERGRGWVAHHLGTRQSAMSDSSSATLSLVVRSIFWGSLTTGLPSRSASSEASGSDCDA